MIRPKYNRINKYNSYDNYGSQPLVIIIIIVIQNCIVIKILRMLKDNSLIVCPKQKIKF